MINPKNITRHELIGLDVEIASSNDPTLKDLKGRIVDETKNTFTIEVGGKRKTVPKGICTFRFSLENERVEITGKALVNRPEDRIKR
jgi:ribonuclease P protein subunit POP4